MSNSNNPIVYKPPGEEHNLRVRNTICIEDAEIPNYLETLRPAIQNVIAHEQGKICFKTRIAGGSIYVRGNLLSEMFGSNFPVSIDLVSKIIQYIQTITDETYPALFDEFMFLYMIIIRIQYSVQRA